MNDKTLIPKPRIPWRHLVAFGWMPSRMKIWCYRHLLQYRIGKHVEIGLGAAVIGKNVDLGDHVSIGFMTIVRGRSIRIGRHTQIGSTSYLLCETIEIGEDAKINEQVFVGGPMLPESRFQLGSRTIVMQMSFLNPTKPLIIGDDSGIGGHCLIFTHGSWLNVLDGYPVTFQGVEIGNSVWLPWRVFVMPGARIGDGSVIGANALVQGEIPPSSLAVGAPAKVIRTAPDFPRKPGPEEQARLVDEMVSEFDRYVVHSGVQIRDGLYTRGKRTYRLVRGAQLQTAIDADCVVLSESPLSTDQRRTLGAAHASWLDLNGRRRSAYGNALCEELALFISRYGIRLVRD